MVRSTRRRSARRARAASPSDQRRAEERQRKNGRPDEIKLLLNRERPVVLNRRWWLTLGKVIRADPREMDVCREDRGPDAVPGDGPSTNVI